jgi:sugar phosphate isomerase/epimerase
MQRGVSLYSYQELYYRGRLDLEGCIANAAATGATGIELLVDQMIPGYPSLRYNLSEAFVDSWHGLLAKYDVKPIAFDIYGETKLFKGRLCSDAELTAQLVELFKAGRALGFSIMRIAFLVPSSVIEALVPYAEDMGIKMAIEVHAPHRIDGPWVQETLEIAQRKGTKSLGIMPDFGTYCRNIPRLALAESRRKAVSDDIIAFLSDQYHEPAKPTDLVERVQKMGGNEAAEWLARRVELNVWMNEDPRLLVPVMPYILHAHGKFYEMTAELIEPDVRYDEVLRVLIEHGYQGYISSEYEGQRLTQGIDPGYDEVEQVKRHQTMLMQYLDQVAAPIDRREGTHGTR